MCIDIKVKKFIELVLRICKIYHAIRLFRVETILYSLTFTHSKSCIQQSIKGGVQQLFSFSYLFVRSFFNFSNIKNSSHIAKTQTIPSQAKQNKNKRKCDD